MLFIVATPIGNLNDISIRAITVLKSVSGILCEDTRVTAKLLSYHQIGKKSLYCYNDLSKAQQRSKIINMLLMQDMALVSDAGTPMISDPGYQLIKQAYQHDIKVTSIPGASAAVNALTLSALPTDKFYFMGFLSDRIAKRQQQLVSLQNIDASIIIYESVNKVMKLLSDIAEYLPHHTVSLLREMTKMYEETICNKTPHEIITLLSSRDSMKGEIVLVLSSMRKHDDANKYIGTVKELAEPLLPLMSVKDICVYLLKVMQMQNIKISKNVVYQLVNDLKQNL